MAVVGRQHGLHPLRRLLRILVDAVRQETVDADAADGDMHDAHLMAFRQVFQQGAAEIIDRSQTGILAAQRRQGLVPLAHLAGLVGEVDGGEVQEIVGHPDGILRLDARVALHIRLPEAEENMEILVLCGCVQYSQGGNH